MRGHKPELAIDRDSLDANVSAPGGYPNTPRPNGIGSYLISPNAAFSRRLISAASKTTASPSDTSAKWSALSPKKGTWSKRRAGITVTVHLTSRNSKGATDS